MAGLLDFLETPEGQGLLAATFGGLAGAQSGTPVNNIGRAGLAGLSGYSGAQDRITQSAIDAQKTKYMQSQTEQNMSQVAAAKTKLDNEARVRDVVSKFGMSDPLGIDTPGAAQSQPKDYMSLIRQGVPFETVKQIADSQNLGKQEVARTIKGIGQDGREYETQFDKFGSAVGDAQAQYKAPITVNQGDRTTFADPYNFKPLGAFNTNQSPDSKASVGASYANAAATRSVAASNVAAANIQRNQATEMKMGDDWRAQAKDFKAAGDAYSQINASLGSASSSPAATLAAATKFMKLLDPGSVVRESELGMALNASGVLDRATNYFSTLQSGQKLTPTQVEDFKAVTKQIYGAAQGAQRTVDENYTRQAKAYGLRGDMIVQNLGQNDVDKPPEKKATKAIESLPAANASNKGQRMRDTTTGQILRSNGMQWKPE